MIFMLYLNRNQDFHHLLLVHFLQVLVPSHKLNENLLERTNFFHVLGKAKETCFGLVEVTILEDDASWSYM